MANRWRQKLIGPRKTVAVLRKTNISKPPISEYNDIILQDLRRTYPLDDWFSDHMSDLSTLLNLYSYTNSGMGYAQGMAFILFVLFKTFHEDDKENALQDTFYAFHRVIEVIRPIYPLGEKDKRPNQFKDSVDRLIYLKLAIHDIRLAEKLKSMPDIVPLFIFQCVPALFANKFETIEDSTILFDFIFCDDVKDTFYNVICILCAILIRFKHIFIHMAYDKILQLLQVKEYYDIKFIIGIANRLK